MVITSSALVSLWQRLVNGKPIGKLVNEKYQRCGLQIKFSMILPWATHCVTRAPLSSRSDTSE